MGRGSPLSHNLREQIIQQFQNNVSQRTIAKNLGISPSTIHNIIKRFRESGEISARKGQGRKPTLNACDLRSLRQHCIKNRHGWIKDIASWAREHFGKPLSVNTVRRCLCKCKLRLYHARRKPYIDTIQKRRRLLWARAHLGWTDAKWRRMLWSDAEATKDLENFDKGRHDEFKRYEMKKEHERRERLKSMNEEDRKKEEQHYEELKKKHANHPKVNHPGSEDQLKEVWQETDGLDPDDFDPKTFFKIHDSNGDGFFDESELEALFTKELEKVYNSENEEDDMVEMEEERLRMREHVMNEVDTNKDRLVSLNEFMEATRKEDFMEKDEWETLDQNPPYTEEELREFEQQLANEENDINQKSADLQKRREELERKEEELNAQKLGLQQAVEEMERLKAQSANAEVKQPGAAVAEGESARVVPGNSQPQPPGHQQQDVPVPGHS
ncbi:uncharacterized protein LOC143321716 isoform X2 [Chaetodon auriga]|uniref:uncharacterized protein LOC143321716 isoform X2 n=1 Tax=Chaetodon auriga TaxID=39042 RepID=UPI004032D5CD